MTTVGNLALKEEVNDPLIGRPPPIDFVNVTLTIEFGTRGEIGHASTALVRPGMNLSHVVEQLHDQNFMWFVQWWMSQHSERVKDD